MLAFSDLRRAAYCPRQLYYARRDDRSPPQTVAAVKAIATRYDEFLDENAIESGTRSGARAASDGGTRATADAVAGATSDAVAGTTSDAVAGTTADGGAGTASSAASLPIEVPPRRWEERLAGASDRFDRFPDLVDPAETEVFLAGRECHGIASKVLPDPPMPSLVSPGKPPESGVWEPHAVWAVAAAKALSWERERRIDEAFVEYPAYGEIRRVRLTTRKKAAYRAAIREVRSLDGPPPRVEDASKCEPCDYAGECGVATRTLRTRLANR